MRAFRLLSLSIALPICLFSQAWLPPKGEGTVSLLYQYGFDRLHAFSDGSTLDAGHMFTNSVVLDTDFSLTNRLAVKVSLPYITGKYVGSSPHQYVRGDPTTVTALDDGTYHGALQDFRVDVRYSLGRGALKVAPFFLANIPTHAYPIFGHAVIGPDGREYRVGVSLGRRLNPILPKAFLQGRYAFGLSQKFLNVAPKVSYGEFQLGYFLTRRLSLQGSGQLTYGHNGLDWVPGLFPNNFTDEQWHNHLRISRAMILDVGAGLGFSLNRSTNVVVSMGHSVYGENVHLHTAVVTVGIVKAFTTKLSAEKDSGLATLPEASKATTCTCAKSK